MPLITIHSTLVFYQQLIHTTSLSLNIRNHCDGQQWNIRKLHLHRKCFFVTYSTS